MTPRLLTHADLASLVEGLTAAHTRVIAPVRLKFDPARIEYMPIHALEDAALGVELPQASIKKYFLPPTEVLLQYKQTKQGVEIKAAPTEFEPQVILGATPCDAAGVEVVDQVMNWGYRDELWFAHREATTIVTLACVSTGSSFIDQSCFCSAVGLGPDSHRGSDLLLTPVEGGYLAEAITPKGEALVKDAGKAASDALQAEAKKAHEEARRKVEANLPAIDAEFPAWLEKNFDHPFWKSAALRCHGCGVCASVCPTCHCFDIVDEHSSSEEGVRRRNWDSCQTAQFTAHSSGYNPRATQSERYRQRILHKFSIYPKRFERILCTGCGRCTRACPGGVSLSEIVGELAAMAKTAPEGGGQ
jgi:ferredoxin